MDKPWKVIMAFVGVFVAGSVFGGLFVMRVGGRILQARNAAPPLAGPGPMLRPGGPQPPGQGPFGFAPLQVAQVMRRYEERLELTPEQQEKIRPVMVRATEDLRRQQQMAFRESGVVLKRLHEDISKELTPEQRTRLGKMEQRQKDFRQMFAEPSLPRGKPVPPGDGK